MKSRWAQRWVRLRVDATRCGLKERRLRAAGGRPEAAGARKAPLPRAALRLAASTRRCTPLRSGPHSRFALGPSVLLLVIATASLASLAQAAESRLTVADLQVEYLTNPLGIDTPQPRFSWKLQDRDHTRGQRQTGYQVLVSSDKAELDRNEGDTWDSGLAASAQSALVPFQGKELRSSRSYYWKVRVLDKDGKPSGWSDVARFAMGLLRPEDWTGSWIMHPDAPKEKHLWYRKALVLDQAVNSALVHVASLGYHELYVNGIKVDDRVLAPALTRLDKRVYYVTHDVTALLRTGRNTIALWYGPGWSRYDAGPLVNIFGVPQAIRLQFEATTAAGKRIAMATDPSWRCQISCSENVGPWRSGGQGDMGGEKVDARRYLPNWNAPEFDESDWLPAKVVAVASELSAQMMEPTRIIETIAAKSVTGDGPYQVDLGRNFTGWIELKMRGQSAGDMVTIQVANRPGPRQDFGQRSSYVCAGGGEESFRNRFNYVGGRYVTLTGLQTKPRPSDVTGHALGTDLQRVGRFSSSNDLFNRIYETDLWTFRANTIEGFAADCPHRERLGYGEVAFATAWGIGLPNYRSGAYYTKVVRDWADVQEENGWINHTAPQINRHAGGPLWSSAGMHVSWATYQTYGDRRILELTYPSSRRWLEFLASQVSAGVLQAYAKPGQFLGDWAAPEGRKELGGTPEALFFNNCVYALNLMTFIRIASVLERTEDVAVFRERLRSLATAVHTRFFDAEKKVYMGGRQVHLAFPLLVGLVPENLRAAVMANLEKEITENHPYLDMGSSGLPVLLKYLIEDAERSDLLAAPLAKITKPGYGYFLSRGETTWPEHWESDVESRIHTCYTGIASFFIKSIAGIRPDPAHPGYRDFVIKPALVGGLSHAEAAIESVYGQIECRWQREGDMVRMRVVIPANSQSTVYVPTSDASSIAEGGNPLRAAEGVAFVRSEGNYVVLRVQSGRYDFTARMAQP